MIPSYPSHKVPHQDTNNNKFWHVWGERELLYIRYWSENEYNCFGNHSGDFFKKMSNSWSNCRTLRQPLNGLHSGQTLLFIHVRCCSSHSCQEEESIWMFMGMTVYGESVTHIQTGLLLSHKKKVNQVNFWQMFDTVNIKKNKKI